MFRRLSIQAADHGPAKPIIFIFFVRFLDKKVTPPVALWRLLPLIIVGYLAAHPNPAQPEDVAQAVGCQAGLSGFSTPADVLRQTRSGG